MSSYSPRRPLARPRPSLSNPNLSASYHSGGRQSPAYNSLRGKQSLNTLTSSSLATIPDADAGYALRSVLNDHHAAGGRMASYTPTRADDLDVGDVVDVPGSMHGTVKFLGTIPGKKGTFAGVELSEEFAFKGKNNGDVDGVSYFTTSIRGAGIFLPVNRATRRGSPSSHEGSFPLTPSTSGFRASVANSNPYTPPTPSLPKFSQSLGPGRAPSPQSKKQRPSAQRPESPLRKPQLGTRPSIGTPLSKTPARYASPAPGKFGQSVRGTQDSRDPSKRVAFTPRNGLKASVGPRSASALAVGPMNFSDDETTPVSSGRAMDQDHDSLGSLSSFTAKIRPASRANDDEVERLRGQLDEKNKQLREQASSLAEMESSLNEVQALMNGSDAGSKPQRASMEDKDSSQLRSLLREKNDKIAMLTAEFDAHRADFRSTIDTLELASTETERVYERRVEDLLQEVRELQERTEDVDSVARQLKQLEELVQELEEGLEDARRGEAEARGEVEFLRGEVERTRSELRREREKAAAGLNVNGANGDSSQASKDLEQRDDEIRGLKAIIHSLSRDSIPGSGSPPDPQKTPTVHQGGFSSNRRSSEVSEAARNSKETLEREVSELRAIVEAKRYREDELERELEKLRRSSATVTAPGQRASAMTVGSTSTMMPDHPNLRDSKGTIASWRDREQRSPDSHRRGNTLDTMPESDAYSSATDSVVFCEICESPGHDILSCTNMFGSQANGNKNNSQNTAATQQRTGKDVVIKGLSPNGSHDGYTPAPLSPTKTRKSAEPTAVVKILPNPMDVGPVAGKESGMIDPSKWCGVCERDGHESIDCPFEDAF
ncbi:CAP-Gly domain containing protein [Phlyctema vagabunda]|uniref:CAP-Gly domain containing protein n=1 Tax=Phlyctema vagabunda TaxID=108571 RepID=A0ABR4P824_9HELO